MITILPETPKNPISLIGHRAGICWNSDVTDKEKNYKRGISCIESDHGRVLEFVNVDMIIEGYSARVMREYMRHVGGGLSCLQESTRYVNCEHFRYYVPSCLRTANKEFSKLDYEYIKIMNDISDSYKKLIELGMSKEDAANILPLGMITKLVDHKNLRNLADMSHKRMCNRAYSEFRELMNDIKHALIDYSDEWRVAIDLLFKPQCEVLGRCPEKNSCGKYNRENNDE